jgi:hypothetical protein
MKPHLILWNPLDGVKALNDYLIINRKEIYDAIYSRIEYAINENKPKLVLFCFSHSDFIMTLNVKDTDEFLQNALNFYSALEEYEKCICIQKWIELIKSNQL